MLTYESGVEPKGYTFHRDSLCPSLGDEFLGIGGYSSSLKQSSACLYELSVWFMYVERKHRNSFNS